jgi:hypothetical protein
MPPDARLIAGSEDVLFGLGDAPAGCGCEAQALRRCQLQNQGGKRMETDLVQQLTTPP